MSNEPLEGVASAGEYEHPWSLGKMLVIFTIVQDLSIEVRTQVDLYLER